MMDPLTSYNCTRDREAEAFLRSPLGEACRISANRRVHYAEDRRVHPEWADIAASLPVAYAFGPFPLDAFYAGRSIGLW